MNDENVRNKAVSELWEHIFAAQTRYAEDAEAKQRRLKREISAPGYSPIKDPQFLKGIATTIRAVEFTGLGGGGLRLPRALVAVQALNSCHINASLHIGALVCRVGPDPRRDVVAFCGPGNAGYGQLFHAWAEVDDHILDFSVSDWEDELGSWLKPFLDRLGHKARRRMCPLYISGLIGPGDSPADGGASGTG